MDKFLKLKTLRRPKLLIRAANSGLYEFNRTRELKNISGISADASNDALFEQLLTEECRLNDERINREVVYDVRAHIKVLTALLAEASNASSDKMAA